MNTSASIAAIDHTSCRLATSSSSESAGTDFVSAERARPSPNVAWASVAARTRSGASTLVSSARSRSGHSRPIPAARIRADHSRARMLSSRAAKDGTRASTRGSPCWRSQTSSAIRSTPNGADERSEANTSSTCSSGTRATNSVGSKSVSAHSRGERVPDVGGVRIGLERGEHLGRRRFDLVVEIHDVGPRDPRRGDGGREPRIGRIGDVGQEHAGRIDLAELQVRGRLEQVTEVGARRVRPDQIRPEAHLPRSTASQEDAGDVRGRRAANRRIGGFRGDLEPIECFVLAEPGEKRARPVESLVAGRRDIVGVSHVLSIGMPQTD